MPCSAPTHVAHRAAPRPTASTSTSEKSKFPTLSGSPPSQRPKPRRSGPVHSRDSE